MLHAWGIRPALFGSIFLLMVSARAETLYHWTGDNGETVYSNVSPPSGVEEFSASAGIPSGSDGKRPTDMTERTASRLSPVAAETESESASVSDQTSQFLKDRISRREASVRHIEELLRSDPENPSLRRQLRKKKQSIREDKIRLALIVN